MNNDVMRVKLIAKQMEEDKRGGEGGEEVMEGKGSAIGKGIDVEKAKKFKYGPKESFLERLKKLALPPNKKKKPQEESPEASPDAFTVGQEPEKSGTN